MDLIVEAGNKEHLGLLSKKNDGAFSCLPPEMNNAEDNTATRHI